MPRLNIPLVDPSLNVAREPRSVVDVPVIAPPQYDTRAAGAIGAGIATVGQGVQQGAELYLQGRAIEERRKHAQDVLDGEEQALAGQSKIQAAYDTLRQSGDPRTLPEDLEQQSKDIIATMGQRLSPGASQAFRMKSMQYLNVLLPRARDERMKQQDAQRKTVLLQSVDTHTQGIINATDETERQYHQQALLGIQQDFKTALLLGPDETAGLVKKITNDVVSGAVRRDIQLDPQQKLDDLRAEAAKGILEIGGVKIDRLIAEAGQTLDSHVRRQEAAEQQRERDALRNNEVALRSLDNEMMDPNASIPQLQATRQRLIALQNTQNIPEHALEARKRYLESRVNGEQQEAKADARAARSEAREARMESRQAAMLKGQEAMQAILPKLYGSTLQMTPEDVLAVPGLDLTHQIEALNHVRQRQRADHVSNTAEFKQATQFLNDTILGPASDIIALESSGVADLQQVAKRRKENLGLAQLELFRQASEMSGADGLNTTQFRQQWEGVARELGTRFSAQGIEPPRPRAGFETPEAVVNAYQQKKVSKSQAESDLLILEAWSKYQVQKAKEDRKAAEDAKNKAEKK